MISRYRESFNQDFSPEKYEAVLQTITQYAGESPTFRVAETPVFLSMDMRRHLRTACREINDLVCRPDIRALTRKAIARPDHFVPNEDEHTLFLQYDFAITRDESGEYLPQLIEMQGFPSLYGYQHLLAQAYRRHYALPDNFTHLLSGLDEESYLELLRRVILNGHHPRHVVLLDIEPEKQNTRIDFWVTSRMLGVKVLCISNLKRSGRALYYLDEEGRKVPVYRLYNRVIFDELDRRLDLPREFNLTEEVDVEWAGHPNWFLRISKYTMPFVRSRYQPPTFFASDADQCRYELDQYVLKPLYSFSGQGVILHPTPEDLDNLPNPEDFILQRRIQYAPVITSPTGEPASRCELRLMMIWEPGTERPRMSINLVRLSRGEMIGVRYNKSDEWVGASIAFFENP